MVWLCALELCKQMCVWNYPFHACRKWKPNVIDLMGPYSIIRNWRHHVLSFLAWNMDKRTKANAIMKNKSTLGTKISSNVGEMKHQKTTWDGDSGQRASLHFDPGVSSWSQRRCVHSPRHTRHATRGTKAYKHNKQFCVNVFLMCVYLSFRYFMGQPSKDCLCCQHTFVCESIFGLWAQRLPITSSG